MAEIITKDRKEYNIWDKINSKWNRLNFLTNAKSVDFDDGKTAQTKLGAIDGITSDLSGESETVAASIKCVNQLNSSFAYDENGIYGYHRKVDGADTVFPFKNVVYLGDGTTFNVSSYKDYRKFTLNNFVASSFDTTTAGGVNVGTAGPSAQAQIIKSYDNTTGILTFKIRSTVIGITQSPFAEGKANGVYLILM